MVTNPFIDAKRKHDDITELKVTEYGFSNEINIFVKSFTFGLIARIETILKEISFSLHVE